MATKAITIDLLNFLNGKIQIKFLELSIIIFRDIKMSNIIGSLSANRIKSGQAALVLAGLALYLWQSLVTSSSSKTRAQNLFFICVFVTRNLFMFLSSLLFPFLLNNTSWKKQVKKKLILITKISKWPPRQFFFYSPIS